MPRNPLQIVVALIAALAVSASAGVGAASAMPARSAAAGGTAVTKQIHAPAVAYLTVQAGATGDGPADDDICSSYEIQINENYRGAAGALDDGDADRAEGLVEAASNVTDMALDAGCFVTDPE